MLEDALTSSGTVKAPPVSPEKMVMGMAETAVSFGKYPENTNAVDSDWVFKYKNKDIQHHQMTLNDGRATFLKSGTDLNTIVETGFYRGDGLVNRPTGSGTHTWTWIKVSKHDTGSWVLQEAIDFNGVVSAYRVKKSGSWQSWKQYAMRDELKNQTNTGWQSAGYAGSYYKRSGDVLAIRFNFTGNGNTFVIATIPASVWVAPQEYMFEIAEWSTSGADTGHVQVNSGTGNFNILSSKKGQSYRGQILLMT